MALLTKISAQAWIKFSEKLAIDNAAGCCCSKKEQCATQLCMSAGTKVVRMKFHIMSDCFSDSSSKFCFSTTANYHGMLQ